MNKTEIKRWLREGWLAGLEDPNTKQTHGQLFKKNKHCCLGVLCDTAGVPRFLNRDLQQPDYCHTMQEEFDLPRYLLKAVGISKQTQYILIEMNDEKGKSLSEIAQFLRKLWN